MQENEFFASPVKIGFAQDTEVAKYLNNASKPTQYPEYNLRYMTVIKYRTKAV